MTTNDNSAPDGKLLVHALVDGELDAANALEVERRIAADPALAAERAQAEVGDRPRRNRLARRIHRQDDVPRPRLGRGVGDLPDTARLPDEACDVARHLGHDLRDAMRPSWQVSILRREVGHQRRHEI